MKIGILQPGYLPWLGFFEQIAYSDVFVIYDDVQYDKEGWRNRNRIKTAQGIQWLTVPVLVKLSDAPLIYDVKIDPKSNWPKKHWRALELNYRKAPFYKKYIDIFAEAYSKEWQSLVDLDLSLISALMACLGLQNKPLFRSSMLNVDGERLERLARICQHFHADTFYEGAAGKNYIDEQYFRTHGITVEYQNYQHPVYNQLYGDFVPYLSVVDLLFNHGEESLAIITGKRL